MTNLFPRAFQAEDWQSWGGWDPAAHPDCSAPPGIHHSIPASLPSSLTLLARASASNTAHSRATWALSCLFALHIDRHFLFTFKPLVARAENGCRLRAHNMVILMISNPEEGTFSNLSCPITSGRHLSIKNSLPLTNWNGKAAVYALFYYIHKGFPVIQNISPRYLHLPPLTCLSTLFLFNNKSLSLHHTYQFLNKMKKFLFFHFAFTWKKCLQRHVHIQRPVLCAL